MQLWNLRFIFGFSLSKTLKRMKERRDRKCYVKMTRQIKRKFFANKIEIGKGSKKGRYCN